MKNISRLLIVAVLAGGFPATQRFGLSWQIILATLGGCGFAGYGYRKGSLSLSGGQLSMAVADHLLWSESAVSADVNFATSDDKASCNIGELIARCHLCR